MYLFWEGEKGTLYAKQCDTEEKKERRRRRSRRKVKSKNSWKKL